MPQQSSAPADRQGPARFDTGAGWRPARFAERGVALPFTTPFLLGGRMRADGRSGAEVVLPHPAGGEGVYILPWSAMPSLCAPTLHDRALWERAATALPDLSPATVRRAARAVALAGHAGRAAARAAAAAEAERQTTVTTLHYGLLLDLLRRIEPAEDAGASPCAAPDDASRLERRIQAALGRLRQEGGPPPAVSMAALGEIACTLEGCGLRAGGEGGARLPRLAAALAAMVTAMEAAAAEAPDDARRAGLRLLAESAGLALRPARAALHAAHALLDDLPALLRRWPEEGADILARLARPEWVLDGWDAIRALWLGPAAGGPAAASALRDMALLVPAVPTEAADWTGLDPAARAEALREGLRLWRRAEAAPGDAPGGASGGAGHLAELTARNEELRALCA